MNISVFQDTSVIATNVMIILFCRQMGIFSEGKFCLGGWFGPGRSSSKMGDSVRDSSNHSWPDRVNSSVCAWNQPAGATSV